MIRTKTIGRLPQNYGDYDPSKPYGKKQRCFLYGCEWESKMEGNTYAPATLNTTTRDITPDTAHWIHCSGSYNDWLIDNGYKMVDAGSVKDGDFTQHDINAGVAAGLNDRYTKSETYSKEEVNGLITTPDQEFVSVEATAQTTAATDVLPATGAADTVYRVGNWDGSQYDPTCYSEYTWSSENSNYVKLSTKDVGIDEVPEIGSKRLIESGAVANETIGFKQSDTWSSNKTFTIGFKAGKTYLVSVSKESNNTIDCGYRNTPSESVTRIFMMSATETYKEQSVTFESDQKYLTIYSSASALIKVEVYDEESLVFKVGYKIDKTSIVDNLSSEDSSKVLSAKQGKVLKDLIDDVDTTELVVSKNLFDKSAVTDNMRQNWYNDSTAAVAGMCMSAHIPVTPGQSYVFSPIVTDVMARVFNSSGTGVQGIDATSTPTFIAHTNASYMVVSCPMSIKDTFQVEKGTVATSYQEYFEPHREVKPEYIPDMEEVNEVTVGTNGDYATILEALKGTDDSIKVHVMRGVYDIIEEYKTVYGNDFWDNYPGYDNSTTDKFMYGLWLGVGRHIVFEPTAVVTFNYSGNNAKVGSDFSVFATSTNVHIEGLTLDYSGCRYAIHDDYAAKNVQMYAGTNIFENCIFDGLPYTSGVIGGGCGYSNTYIVKDCLFNVRYNDPTSQEENKNIIAYHNPSGSNAINHIIIENCVGNGSIAFNWYGTSTDVTKCQVTNCKCKYISCAAHSSTPHDNVNMKLIDWNNVTNIGNTLLWE